MSKNLLTDEMLAREYAYQCSMIDDSTILGIAVLEGLNIVEKSDVFASNVRSMSMEKVSAAYIVPLVQKKFNLPCLPVVKDIQTTITQNRTDTEIKFNNNRMVSFSLTNKMTIDEVASELKRAASEIEKIKVQNGTQST